MTLGSENRVFTRNATPLALAAGDEISQVSAAGEGPKVANRVGGRLGRMYLEREKLPLRTRLLFTLGAVAALHVATLVLMMSGSSAAMQPLGLGLVVTAYMAGIKHSYDWDHLAAIDNSTRRFVARGSDPVSVGFAFSLGHSSVVFLTGLLLVMGATSIGELMIPDSGGNKVLGLIGGGVSGLFLLVMGLFNGSAFFSAMKIYLKVRAGGRIRDCELETKGLIARLLTRPLSKVERPRHIYVIGFLFGLGFDTATTIGLLVLTTTATLAGVSPVALMALPLAFTAAMTLCDTANGFSMLTMYKAAVQNPLRKLGFNALITGISAASALLISGLTLTGLVNEAFELNDPITTWLRGIDLGDTGLMLVAVFATAWIASTITGRRKNQSRPQATPFEGLED